MLTLLSVIFKKVSKIDYVSSGMNYLSLIKNSYACENCEYKANLKEHLNEHVKANHAKFCKTSNDEIINTICPIDL